MGLIAYDTSRKRIIGIAKHCLTATGCPSDPGAHMIGQQVFPGLGGPEDIMYLYCY